MQKLTQFFKITCCAGLLQTNQAGTVFFTICSRSNTYLIFTYFNISHPFICIISATATFYPFFFFKLNNILFVLFFVSLECSFSMAVLRPWAPLTQTPPLAARLRRPPYGSAHTKPFR